MLLGVIAYTAPSIESFALATFADWCLVKAFHLRGLGRCPRISKCLFHVRKKKITPS